MNTECEEEDSFKSKKESGKERNEIMLNLKISYRRSKIFTNCNIYSVLSHPDRDSEVIDATKDDQNPEETDGTKDPFHTEEIDDTKDVRKEIGKDKKKKAGKIGKNRRSHKPIKAKLPMNLSVRSPPRIEFLRCNGCFKSHFQNHKLCRGYRKKHQVEESKSAEIMIM